VFLIFGGHCNNTPSWKQKPDPLSDIESGGDLILDFPVSRAMKNKVLIYLLFILL
jgi:hypothetical protein